jgi:limonene-1,2-epoxide hydrolase
MGQNQTTVEEFIAAWGRIDIDEIMSFFQPDAVYDNIPVNAVTGTDAIRQVITGFAGDASKIEWIVRNIAESASGAVLTERLDRFQIAGKWIELRVMGIFELRDGKIAHWRDYFEMKQFTEQLPTG